MEMNQNAEKIYNISSKIANFWDDSIAKIKEWVMPLSKPNFIVGRENTILEIATLLNERKNVLLINGLGGIGKTLIAREVYHRYSNKYNKLLWLNASRSLYDAFTSDTLLDALRLKEKVMDLQNENKSKQLIAEFVIELIYKYGTFPSLMIIDNVDDGIDEGEDKILHDFILNKIYVLSEKWLVMFTSRCVIPNCVVKEIDFLHIDDAVKLFQNHYTRNCSEEQIKSLVYSVGRHTLTVEMLAKTAAFLDWEFEELEKKLKINGLSITDNADFYLEHAGKKINHVNTLSYLDTIFSISKLDSLSIAVLRLFSLFPQEKIQKSIVSKLYSKNRNEDINEDTISRCLKNLSTSGWLQFHREAKAYSIHTVIAEVIRNKEANHFKIDNFLPIIQNLTDTITDNGIAISEDYNILINLSLAFIHRFSHTNHLKIHSLCIYTGHLCSVVSQFATCTELAKNAETILSNRVKQAPKKASKDYIPYLLTVELMATALTNFTKYQEAYTYQKKLVEEIENAEIEDKDMALIALKIYERAGYILNRLEINKMDDAKQYAYKGLEIIEKFQIHKTLEASNIYNLLKMVHQHFEEFDIAIEYGKKAIEICETVLGESHPNLPVCHNNIMTTYLMMKDWKNGLKHTLIAKKYCDNYPLINESHLGQCYSNLGMLYEEKARQILNKAAIGLTKSINTNVHFLAHKNYEARQKECNKIFEKNMTFFKKSLNVFLKLHLDESTSIANIYKNMANNSGFLGKFENVIKFSKMSLEIYEKRLQYPHHLLGEANMSIALGNRDLGKFEKAKYHIEKALKIYREVYINDSNEHIKEASKIKKEIERKLQKKKQKTKS
ncbi:MAG: hypothetical protein RLZZ628_2364 [Bacteroidota bacterium]|jgi:tetratricopeptide (TPR) repeat protein